MDILILGGTRFLGRHLVEAAQARGHHVTLFNRGQSNPDVFPDVEQLNGDRNADLSALQGRKWDAAIDTCAFFPRQVAASVAALHDSIQHYTLISSISVYADASVVGMDETEAVGELDDPTVEEITGETYGPLKALCEQAAEAGLPGRVLNVRPGLIVGPFDPTDRFTYWPVRVSRGGAMLCPDQPELPTQLVDARDLAAWIIQSVEQGRTGECNATGPAERLTVRELLEASREVSGSDAEFVWTDASFLEEHTVDEVRNLPVFSNDEYAGLMQVNIDKATDDGLTFRPLEQTIRDTIAWAATRPPDYQWRMGLTPERELELLQRWHEQGTVGDATNL